MILKKKKTLALKEKYLEKFRYCKKILWNIFACYILCSLGAITYFIFISFNNWKYWNIYDDKLFADYGMCFAAQRRNIQVWIIDVLYHKCCLCKQEVSLY